MSKIAGITTTKNAKGEITTITINMKKHGAALMPVLKGLGLVEKTQFEKECEEGIPADQAHQMLLNHVRELWKK